MEISVSDLWKVLRKCLIVMLVVALVAGIVTYLIVANGVQKVYSTSFSMTMVPNAPITQLSELSQSIAVANALMSGQLLTALESEDTADELLRFCEEDYEALKAEEEAMIAAGQTPDFSAEDWKLSRKYTARNLASMISVAYNDAVSGTTYHLSMRITIRAYTSRDCGILAQSMRNHMGELIEKYNTLYQLLPLEKNVKYGVQVEPHPLLAAVIAAVLGFVLPYAITLLICLTDKRIYTEEDLKKRFANYPILGQVPSMDR